MRACIRVASVMLALYTAVHTAGANKTCNSLILKEHRSVREWFFICFSRVCPAFGWDDN